MRYILVVLIFWWTTSVFGQITLGEIQHPSFDVLDDGSISLTLNTDLRPVSVFLDDNQVGVHINDEIYTISDLSAGTYGVKVVDKTGCETLFTVELSNEGCPSGFNVSLSDYQRPSGCIESDCGGEDLYECTADGSIVFRVSGSDNFKVYLNNEIYGENITIIEDLTVGQIAIEIVDDNSQCSKRLELNIEACGELVEAEDQFDGECYSYYSPSRSSNIYNFDFEVIPAIYPDCNGQIIPLPPRGNIHEYAYEVFTFNPYVQHDIFDGLCPDEYFISVSDGCQEVSREDWYVVTVDCILPDIEVDLEVEVDADCQIISVEPTTTGSLSNNLSYRWSRDATVIGTDRILQYNGLGEVVLRITDEEKGCYHEERYEYNGFVLHVADVEEFCPDRPFGTITLSANDPGILGDQLSIYLDDVLLSEQDFDLQYTGDNTVITIPEVIEGVHSLIVEVNGCRFTFAQLFIGPKEIQYEFLSFDQDQLICTYSEICDGLPTGNNRDLPAVVLAELSDGSYSPIRYAVDAAVSVPQSLLDILGLGIIGSIIGEIADWLTGAAISFFNVITFGIFGSGDGEACNTAYSCFGTEDVVTEDSGTDELRAWEYAALVINLNQVDQLSDEALAAYLDYVDFENFDENLVLPCRRITFCKDSFVPLSNVPGTVSAWSVAGLGNEGCWGCGEVLPAANGCNDISGLIEEYGDLLGDEYCVNTRKEYMGNLIRLLDEGRLEAETEIHDFIEDMRDFYDPTTGTGVCFEVTYCAETGRIVLPINWEERTPEIIRNPDCFTSISLDNPTIVDVCDGCSTPCDNGVATFDQCEQFESENGGESCVYVCELKSISVVRDIDGNVVGCNPNYVYDVPCNPNSSIRITNDQITKRFKNLAIEKFDQNTFVVQSLVQTPEDGTGIIKSYKNVDQYHVTDIDGVDFLYNNFENENGILSREFDDFRFLLFSKKGSSANQLIYRASLIEENLFVSSTNETHVSGIANEMVIVGETSLESQGGNSLIYFGSYDENGSTQSEAIFQLPHNLENTEVVYSHGDRSSIYSYLKSDTIFNYSYVDGQLIDYKIPVTGALSLQSVFMDHSSELGLLLEGTGTLQLSGGDLAVTNISLVKLNGDRELLWTDDINLGMASYTDINQYHESTENILILSFTDEVGNANFFKYRCDTGEMIGMTDIQASNTFNIKELYYNSGMVHFGGEISAGTSQIDLGNVRFYNLQETTSMVYVSNVDL